MDIYRKNCKKHTRCTHPKLLLFMSNRKAKVKPKCEENSTYRTLSGKSTTKSQVHDFFNKIDRIRN